MVGDTRSPVTAVTAEGVTRSAEVVVVRRTGRSSSHPGVVDPEVWIPDDARGNLLVSASGDEWHDESMSGGECE